MKPEDPGQHFDRRRFAGPIGSDVSDEFARFERHRHAVDGHPFLTLATEQRAQCAALPAMTFDRTKDFAQIARFDDRHPSMRVRAASAAFRPGTDGR